MDRLFQGLAKIVATALAVFTSTTLSANSSTPTPAPEIIADQAEYIEFSREFTYPSRTGGEDYHVAASISMPKNGGAITGSVDGTCDGDIQGTYDGQENVSGSFSGSCAVLGPVSIPGEGTYSGKLNQDTNQLEVDYTLTAPGYSRSGTLTLGSI